MTKNVNFLITFDYELPLGRVDSYPAGMFDPTDKILDLANAEGVPIVLFTDICSGIRFKDWDYDNFYKPLRAQLHRTIKEGHDAQLHIHPHWMNSTFINNQYRPSQDFSLSHFKDNDEISIEEIIELAAKELTKICKEADPDYRCIAYRAGGYNVEPESKRILSKLYELGIRYDSSVLPGLFLNFSFNKVDYTNVPNLPEWPISKEGPLAKVALNSDMKELPISCQPISIGYILNRRIKKWRLKEKLQQRKYNPKGVGLSVVSEQRSLKDKLANFLNPLPLTFDKEYLEVKDLEKIVDYNVNKFATPDKDLNITVIAHPKSMGEFHLDLMKGFINRMREKYGSKANFTTYQKLYKLEFS